MQLLAGAPGGGNVLHVLVHVVHDGLNVGVKAAVNAVAAVIEQGGGRIIADALQLHQVGDHIVNDHFLVVGVNLLGVFLPGAVDKGGGDILVHRVDIHLIVDIALVVHLAQDGLLTFLVLLFIIEGIIERGLVGDAYDAGGLGQRKLRHVLAKIGFRRGLNAPAALAEVDRVEIPLDDLLFVVLLFQLQRAEDFRQLSLDGHVVLAGQVLDELLGDGGAAVAGLHLGKHLHKSAGGAVPVHALVLVKTLILDGYQRFFHIPGDLLVVHPNALLLAGQGDQLLPLAGGVLIIDGAGLAELVVLQRDIGIGRQTGLYIVGKDAGKEQPCNKEYE